MSGKASLNGVQDSIDHLNCKSSYTIQLICGLLRNLRMPSPSFRLSPTEARGVCEVNTLSSSRMENDFPTSNSLQSFGRGSNVRARVSSLCHRVFLRSCWVGRRRRWRTLTAMLRRVLCPGATPIREPPIPKCSAGITAPANTIRNAWRSPVRSRTGVRCR